MNLQVGDRITYKELLTEEEKEFLKDMCKYYGCDVKIIWFTSDDVFISTKKKIINIIKIPKNMEFKNVELLKEYTLKGLGLEE